MLQRAFLLAALVGCLTSCGGSAAPVDAAMPEDVGLDAGPSDVGVIVDAFVPVDAPPECDVSPEPAGLAPLVGSFVVLEPDAGLPIPPLTGGDPTGVWRFDHVTIYTGSSSAGMFDPATSTVEGTAWAVVEGDQLRLSLTFDVALMGTVAGTIRRHTVTTMRGTYAVDGSALDLALECISPATAGGARPMFSAEGATGTLVLTTMGMLGVNQIVLSGARTAT